jgi:glutathione S-transferase
MAAKELGLELNLKVLDLMKKEQMAPEFLKINPQHCIPTLDDNGFVIWESRAVLTYLVNKYSPGHSLYPSCPQKRATIDRFLQWDVGAFYPAIGGVIYPKFLFGKEPEPEKFTALTEKMALLETMLGSNQYLTGDTLTLADLSIYAGLSMLEISTHDLSSTPNIAAWVLRMKALPYDGEINAKAMEMARGFIAARDKAE